jgi:hypothetical protein
MTFRDTVGKINEAFRDIVTKLYEVPAGLYL